MLNTELERCEKGTPKESLVFAESKSKKLFWLKNEAFLERVDKQSAVITVD